MAVKITKKPKGGKLLKNKEGSFKMAEESPLKKAYMEGKPLEKVTIDEAEENFKSPPPKNRKGSTTA